MNIKLKTALFNADSIAHLCHLEDQIFPLTELTKYLYKVLKDNHIDIDPMIDRFDNMGHMWDDYDA